MRSREEMEDVFGPAAAHSEHQRGQNVRYRLPGESGILSGEILWVCAATSDMQLRYVIMPDSREGFPDVVFPAQVID
jgi:hypothetical protein